MTRMDWLRIAIITLCVAGAVIGVIWLAWWSTGQFFSGGQHWAAFYILLLLIGGGSSRRP